MSRRSERMASRTSEVSQIISRTPEKRRRSSRIMESAKKAATPKRQTDRLRGAPIFKDDSSSSSSSSEEDEDDVVKEKDLESSGDERMDVDSEEDFSEEVDEKCWRRSSEKENRSVTRSRSKSQSRSQSRSRVVLDESPSKKVARKLSTMNVRTPSKASKSPREGVNSTARKTLHKKRVFSNSEDDDYSDEIDDNGRLPSPKPRSLRTPIPKLRIPKAALNKKVTPLVIHKTPGGTLRTRQRLRRDSDEELFELKDPLVSESAKTLRELASRLHLSKVPEKLPCRDHEAREIEKFIREVIDPKWGESSAMYISGVPGTGKTATVRAVVNSMQKNKRIPKFVYVEVNAMIFKKTVFVEVYNGIEQGFSISKKTRTSKITATAARQELNAIFRKEDPNRPPIVILIDELDSLCNRKQDVLYDIFEWTALPQSKVTIIGIANTLDFPERMLCQRNASRLDKRRLVFQPYQHEQIEEIVRARLQGSQLVEPKAVELVAKKVAMNTGDLRQALDFLCRSIQVAVEQKADRLELRHVCAAQSAVLEPFKYRLVKGLRLHPFILFRAIEAMTREQEEVRFGNVYKTYCRMCTDISGLKPSTDSFAYDMLLLLSSTGLVQLGKGDHGTSNRKIKLGMTTMEAEKAVKAYTDTNKTFYSI